MLGYGNVPVNQRRGGGERALRDPWTPVEVGVRARLSYLLGARNILSALSLLILRNDPAGQMLLSPLLDEKHREVKQFPQGHTASKR